MPSWAPKTCKLERELLYHWTTGFLGTRLQNTVKLDVITFLFTLKHMGTKIGGLPVISTNKEWFIALTRGKWKIAKADTLAKGTALESSIPPFACVQKYRIHLTTFTFPRFLSSIIPSKLHMPKEPPNSIVVRKMIQKIQEDSIHTCFLRYSN